MVVEFSCTLSVTLVCTENRCGGYRESALSTSCVFDLSKPDRHLWKSKLQAEWYRTETRQHSWRAQTLTRVWNYDVLCTSKSDGKISSRTTVLNQGPHTTPTDPLISCRQHLPYCTCMICVWLQFPRTRLRYILKHEIGRLAAEGVCNAGSTFSTNESIFTPCGGVSDDSVALAPLQSRLFCQRNECPQREKIAQRAGDQGVENTKCNNDSALPGVTKPKAKSTRRRSPTYLDETGLDTRQLASCALPNFIEGSSCYDYLALSHTRSC